MGQCNAFADLEEGDDAYAYRGQYYYTEFNCDGDDNDPDAAACFASSSKLLLESGKTVFISDASIGDRIQTVASDGTLSFSDIVYLPHLANTEKAQFIDLQLASGASLRATPQHLVRAGKCGSEVFDLIPMEGIQVGMCMQKVNGEDQVLHLQSLVEHGIYTVVTKEVSGLIIVNGLVVSSFSHNHWLVNTYYHIHRSMYAIAPWLLRARDLVAVNLLVGDFILSL